MKTKVTVGQPIMAEQINRLNKIVVLNILREKKEISRADIVKLSGLSAPTVTRIVDSLIHNEELAVQVGIGESKGGRPPVIVRFNGENNYVIGIDWGRTHIHGVVANLNGEIILSKDIPVDSEGSFDKDIITVIGLIKVLVEYSGLNSSKILGIGLAVAGFINKSTGNVEFSPNFGWSKVNIKKVLQQKFDIPIMVDNVSRVMAVGESCYGLGAKLKSFVFVNIGYGIGAGIIVDGKSFKGYDGFSGEIGHINIANSRNTCESQRSCVCGKTDCLECYVSGRGITQTVKQEINNYPDSLINNYCKNNVKNITTEIIAQAAKAGDSYAKRVFEDAAIILATTFANFSNILNPQAIIIGGKVANAGDFFIDKIRKTFQKETLPHVNRKIEIIKSGLIGEAAAKGAVALILKEVLDLNVQT